jgi:hypothetical protein
MFITDDLSVDRLEIINLRINGLSAEQTVASEPLDPDVGVAIPIDAFLSFVHSLEGEVIQTSAGRAQFTVRIVETGLEFAPLSTQQPRGHTRAYVQRVLDHFRETGSFSTADYQFTVNASYQLALIDRYLRR